VRAGPWIGGSAATATAAADEDGGSGLVKALQKTQTTYGFLGARVVWRAGVVVVVTGDAFLRFMSSKTTPCLRASLACPSEEKLMMWMAPGGEVVAAESRGGRRSCVERKWET
jgi:hypothetical protein